MARWWTGCVAPARSGARRPEVIVRSSPGRKCPAYRSFPLGLFTGNAGQGQAMEGGREVGTEKGQMMGGEGCQCSGVEVPRLSLEQHHVSLCHQELPSLQYCCCSVPGMPPASDNP